VAVDNVEQHRGRGPAFVHQGLSNRGESNQVGDRRVVETDHRDVFGDADTPVRQDTNRRSGVDIRRCDNRRRIRLDQRCGRGDTTLHVDSGGLNQADVALADMFGCGAGFEVARKSFSKVCFRRCIGVDVAAESGYDRAAFAAALGSEAMREATARDFERSRSLGVSGFPTLGVAHGPQVYLVTSGFVTDDVLEHRLAEIERRVAPPATG